MKKQRKEGRNKDRQKQQNRAKNKSKMRWIKRQKNLKQENENI